MQRQAVPLSIPSWPAPGIPIPKRLVVDLTQPLLGTHCLDALERAIKGGKRD